MVYTSWGSSDFRRSSTFSFLMSFSICVWVRRKGRNGDQLPVNSMVSSPYSLALLLPSPLPSRFYFCSPLPLCLPTCTASVSTVLFRSWMSSAVGVSVSMEYTGGSGGGARNMGYWQGKEGHRQDMRATQKSGDLFAPCSSSNKPILCQIRPLRSGQWPKVLTWGLSRASSSIFCHISSLSFMRNRPLRGHRQDGGA